MGRSSIDVIEEVLGDRLFPPAWTARSLSEVDVSSPAYQAPAISRRQYHDIQERLQQHWSEVARTFAPDRSCLFIGLRNIHHVHQFASLAALPFAEREAADRVAFSVMVKRQVSADAAVVARRALLYSEKVVLNDPAHLMAKGPANAQSIPPDSDRDDKWKMWWTSAIAQLGLLHKLVKAEVVTLFPIAGLSWGLPADDTPGGFADREAEQVATLQALYRSEPWKAVLATLPFPSWQEAGVHVAWALGQFAWRNAVLPGTTPWLPDAECVGALVALERALGDLVLGPESLTISRLSSRVGLDIAKVSDEEIIALRSSEELFATWRQIVAELSLEADRLAIDRPADLKTLVRAKQTLWRGELERRTGSGGVLSGLLDANPIACGVITGGAALASGVPPVLSAVSALGGGLVTPLIRLFGNLAGAGTATSRRKAVAAHFMALEG